MPARVFLFSTVFDLRPLICGKPEFLFPIGVLTSSVGLVGKCSFGCGFADSVDASSSDEVRRSVLDVGRSGLKGATFGIALD